MRQWREGSDAENEGSCSRRSGALRDGVVEGAWGLVQHDELARTWGTDGARRRLRAQIRSLSGRCRNQPHRRIVHAAVMRRLPTELGARRRASRLVAFAVFAMVGGGLRRG